MIFLVILPFVALALFLLASPLATGNEYRRAKNYYGCNLYAHNRPKQSKAFREAEYGQPVPADFDDFRNV